MYLLIVFLPLLGSSVAGFFGRFLGSEVLGFLSGKTLILLLLVFFFFCFLFRIDSHRLRVRYGKGLFFAVYLFLFIVGGIILFCGRIYLHATFAMCLCSFLGVLGVLGQPLPLPSPPNSPGEDYSTMMAENPNLESLFPEREASAQAPVAAPAQAPEHLPASSGGVPGGSSTPPGPLGDPSFVPDDADGQPGGPSGEERLRKRPRHGPETPFPEDFACSPRARALKGEIVSLMQQFLQEQGIPVEDPHNMERAVDSYFAGAEEENRLYFLKKSREEGREKSRIYSNLCRELSTVMSLLDSLVEIRENSIQFSMETEFCEFSPELEDHFEIFEHIRGFNVTIVTSANTQDETLLPWSGFLQKDEGQ
ncbi:uncharacterized protein LOC110715378 [Chenopodium quinoa]|uniref:uncharacterized protein LOC110715378 n=1 Tax=Chenopodium quinoa TaxID=63459 RepID=UPI000B777AC6|nr:uncharacterized protein LOC110715378 [Chenopodium quinoa]